MSQKIIATQIDLARRKETPAEIRAFLDHAARFGYNTVCFYLEDRVKTAAYPYAPDEESYTPDEMRELVSYAAGLGIDIIPAVSNHSHCERFLEHAELLPMAELYGNIEGRFASAGSAAYLTTCLSNPLTYEFFDRYYAELAEIFPSPYFNVGLDEGFDIASCPRCRARFERNGGFGTQFIEHITHTRDLLHSLGKTMMMFDDMFYFFPEKLCELPRDVILLSWNYEYIDRTPGAQFRNSMKRDLFADYDRLGIRYMPLSWTNFDYNVDTLTAYADRYDPIGYYATTWQMTTEPLLTNYVSVAYAGMLWNGILADKPYERMKRAVRETLGCDLTESQASAIAMAASKVYANRAPRNFHFADGVIVRRNVNFDEEHKLNLMLRDQLADAPKNKFTDFYLSRLDSAIRVYDQLTAAQDLFDYRTGLKKLDRSALVARLAEIRRETEREIEGWEREWKIYRDGIPRDYAEYSETMLADCDKLIADAESAVPTDRGALDMTILLPDKSTRSLISLDVEYSDGTAEHLGTGIYKPYATACYNISEKGPYVYNVTFLTHPTAIKSLTVTVSSYGSSTICYFCQRIGKDTYTPTRIASTFGRVYAPERLLTNDTLAAEIGDGDMARPFRHRPHADEKHGVVIEFS